MVSEELAKSIDHTLLRPGATNRDIQQLCEEGLKYNFASICVYPWQVELVVSFLKQSPVKVATVISFPFGGATTNVKRQEASDAIARGAQELEVVMNVGALKSGELDYALEDMATIVQVARRSEVEKGLGFTVVKMIIENSSLTEEERKICCRLVAKAGADFLKTSTGFGPRGVTADDVRWLRKHLASEVGIKASGGIRTYEQAIDLLDAGAVRLGTSGGVSIMEELFAKKVN